MADEEIELQNFSSPSKQELLGKTATSDICQSQTNWTVTSSHKAEYSRDSVDQFSEGRNVLLDRRSMAGPSSSSTVSALQMGNMEILKQEVYLDMATLQETDHPYVAGSSRESEAGLYFNPFSLFRLSSQRIGCQLNKEPGVRPATTTDPQRTSSFSVSSQSRFLTEPSTSSRLKLMKEGERQVKQEREVFDRILVTEVEERNTNYSNSKRKGDRRRSLKKTKVDMLNISSSAPTSGASSSRTTGDVNQSEKATSSSDTSNTSSPDTEDADEKSDETTSETTETGDKSLDTSKESSEDADSSEKSEDKEDMDSSEKSEDKEDMDSSEKSEDKEDMDSSEKSEDKEDMDSSEKSEDKEDSEDVDSKENSEEVENKESSESLTKEDTDSDGEENKGKKKKKKKKRKKKRKKKKKKVKKRRGLFDTIMKSSPSEQPLLKIALWFPVGIGLSFILYYFIIEKMHMEEQMKQLIGAALGLILSLSFAFSIQIRCIMTLVIPSFVGKAGRSYFSAFAIVYLINGPITNIMDNYEEVVRTMTCNTALTANHTKTLFLLRVNPLTAVFGDIMKDNYVVTRASKSVKKAFKPLRKEMEENKLEERELKKDIKQADKKVDPKARSAQKTEKKFQTQRNDKDAAKKVEKEFSKKAELRCQGIFGKGVDRCVQKMRQLEDKCMDKLSFIGYILCWPLKITFFCHLIKLVPSAIGTDCDSTQAVQPGFGETYLAAEGVMNDMDEGSQVNLQYKVVGSAEANYMPFEEIRKAAMFEVKRKTAAITFVLTCITYMLTFTFILIFFGAYKYNKKYLKEMTWDNNYITRYFRHIDARRKAQGKRTLLPLKKAEKKKFYDPHKIKLSVAEKKTLIKGTIVLLLRVFICAIICYMDSLFYQILIIVAKHSRLEFHQTGQHIMEIKVGGKGFMSALVATFLEKFNTRMDVDSVTTNYECLPRPTKTDAVVVASIFGTYLLIWLFMYFQAFGLRLRRVIAAFYYRKKEKKRVLYLYNEMYRKRVGFLVYHRKRVKKQLRERELKHKISLFLALKRRYPRLCKCLGVFKTSKDTCIICGEAEDKNFYFCPTKGCGIGYCRECWIDVKKKCLACGQVSEDEDEDTDDSETVNDGNSSTVDETE